MTEDISDRIALVELYVPGTENSSPEGFISIGRHYAQATKRTGSYKLGDVCGGDFVLSDSQGQPVGRGTAEALYVHCAACGYQFYFGVGNQRIAVAEWRKLVFAAALYRLVYPGTTEGRDALLRLGSFVERDLSSFTAPSDIFLFDIPGFAYHSHFPYWPAHKMAVIRVAGVEEMSLEGRMLVLTIGLLLHEMEQEFQSRIERLSQGARSASESFHPKTRRYT